MLISMVKVRKISVTAVEVFAFYRVPLKLLFLFIHIFWYVRDAVTLALLLKWTISGMCPVPHTQPLFCIVFVHCKQTRLRHQGTRRISALNYVSCLSETSLLKNGLKSSEFLNNSLIMRNTVSYYEATN